MSSFIDRVKALNLPTDQFVVIGSGLLDVYGLREAHDIDLVVSHELFLQLGESPEYDHAMKHDEDYLLSKNGDVEIWETWADKNFDELYEGGQTVEGVMFSSTSVIIEYKRGRGTEKDLKDIGLLETYEKR